MTNSWIKATTQNQIDSFTSEFWAGHKEDLRAGEFCADKIKAFKGEPVKRLELAIKNFPLPAAFREATVALRSLIREKRKNSNDHQDEIAFLYWLAAIDSFSVPYSESLCEPGYNVIESIPGKVVKNLSFTYHEVGYNKLPLLNLTDIKWIVELWGEPENHSTLNVLHNKIWHEYELKLLMHRKQQNQNFAESLFKLLSAEQLIDISTSINKLENNK